MAHATANWLWALGYWRWALGEMEENQKHKHQQTTHKQSNSSLNLRSCREPFGCRASALKTLLIQIDERRLTVISSGRLGRNVVDSCGCGASFVARCKS